MGSLIASAVFAASASAVQVINATPITINDATVNGVPRAATPYPSNIIVSGQAGVLTSLSVTMSGIAHSSQKDIDVLLAGPTGVAVFLTSDTGGRCTPAPGCPSSADLGWRDSAASGLPATTTASNQDLWTSGFFRPTDNDVIDFPGCGSDSLPAPAPAATGTTIGQFLGTDPNGTWRLFVTDDCVLDAGTGAGWALTFEIGPAPDISPPDTTISDGPPKKTRKKFVNFEFFSSEVGSTFECSLDEASFAACSSPVRVKAKKRGRHEMRIRAIDSAANADPTPAAQGWKKKRKKKRR